MVLEHRNISFISRILLLVCLLQTTALSQREGNIWFFGRYAGLDFNSGVPVPISGKLNTTEGCASVCDYGGNLLFYTDGTKVWDRNHQQMPNGENLAGHSSATQSAIVVPMPGDFSKYYIFTVDPFERNQYGFRYSIVDMTLNNGFGDINDTDKNIELLSESTEKVTSVKHKNGMDYWVE